jgi:hypothetical protein
VTLDAALVEVSGYFDPEQITEPALALRRALSAGRLRSFLIDADGFILPLYARIWNTKEAHGLFTGEHTISFTIEGDGRIGPEAVFLLVDELHAWLASLFDAGDPVRVCAAWLSDMMKRSPTSSPPKQQLRDEAKAKFKGLSSIAFNTAWRLAKANNPTAMGWGRAGRKPKPERNPKRNPE